MWTARSRHLTEKHGGGDEFTGSVPLIVGDCAVPRIRLEPLQHRGPICDGASPDAFVHDAREFVRFYRVPPGFLAERFLVSRTEFLGWQLECSYREHSGGCGACLFNELAGFDSFGADEFGGYSRFRRALQRSAAAHMSAARYTASGAAARIDSGADHRQHHPVLDHRADHCSSKSIGGLTEPAGEVAVQVLLIVADPGNVAVGA